MRQEHTLKMTPVHPRALHTHIFTVKKNLESIIHHPACLLGGGRKLEKLQWVETHMEA